MLGVSIALKYIGPSEDFESILEMIGMLNHQLEIGFPDVKMEHVIIQNLLEDEPDFDGPKLDSDGIDEALDEETSKDDENG